MVQETDRGRPGLLTELDSGWRIWRLAVLRSAGLPFGMLERFACTAQLGEPAGPEREAAMRARDMDAVNEILADNTVVSALTWQNPSAIRNWVAAHRKALRSGPVDFPPGRRNLRSSLTARYAQRYCAKNETIGFFGPVAWARFADGPSRILGSGDVIRRTISYEVLALKSVADAWTQDPRLRPYLPVRLDPACAVEGDMVYRPHRSAVRLDAPTAKLVAMLDEVACVGELADRLGMPVNDVHTELTKLGRQRIVQLGFLVPVHESPEDLLRGQLSHVTDPRIAALLRERLDRLDRAKASLYAAPDPEALMEALADVDLALAEACGGHDDADSARAGRGQPTVYHDCRRDLDAMIGPAELGRLAVPLGVLLDSASWLARQVGDLVAEGLLERYHELRERRERVSVADLQFCAADLLSTGGPGLASVIADFHRRWAEILGTAQLGDRMLNIDASQARTVADAAFPAGSARWSAARLHSPDVMLAETPAGLRWVIGELHVAVNTLESRVFATQADDRSELIESMRAVWPGGRVLPVYPTDGREVSSRTYPPPALDPPGLFRYWSYATDDGHADGAASVPAAGLLVYERHGELIAEAGNGGWVAPVLECFGEFLSALVGSIFHILPTAGHTPRVMIGDVVIAREAWRFRPDAVPVELTRAQDYAHDRLREWAARHQLPRHVFVRTPLEAKPFYIDWNAPLLVENLARLARKLRGEPGHEGQISVVEMVPAPDQLWLSDPDGHRYTSEIRLVAVDPAPSPPTFRPRV